MTIRDFHIRDTRQANLVINTSNSKVVDNVLKSNKIGIWLLKCSYCIIRDCIGVSFVL
ncbi:MAG: hypothetical protein J7L47_06470 [Candidatus Odinarchaeota archaeon]|nr:hypothetical protein [Candidatus Odinarchaeota archaeon]